MAKDKDFTPREIEVFAAVMLHGTTTKAADALDITQPAVSKVLAHMTDKAGFQLFRNSRQRLTATPEAHMLYAEVQRTFESARSISRAAKEIRELKSGRLSICALPAFGLTLLPEIITEFVRLHPTVAISVDIRSSLTVIQRASRNQLDIGIGVTASEEHPAIARRALASTPPVFVMPKGHTLSHLKVIQVEDLEGLDFISMSPSDPMRRQLDDLCDQRGVQRNMKMDVSLSRACLDLVAHGAGVALIDRLSAWSARDLPIEIRDFRPGLELNLSVYRPWGVIQSNIADAFNMHLIQTTRRHMNAIDAAILASST